MTINAYHQLELKFTTVAHLNHIDAFLKWDEAVMMPAGGGSARAKALATLNGIHHELLTDPRTQQLLAEAKAAQAQLDEWQQANLFWIEKQINEANALPLKLVTALTESTVHSEQAWRRYRDENNWADFVPYLKKTFTLVKEAAEIRAAASNKSPYDVLIEDYSPGMDQALIDPIFQRLKTELPPLIDEIINQQRKSTHCIPVGPFAVNQQKLLGEELMRAIGFDFNHGRLDTSHHPFCGGVPEDVRITTRYQEDNFISALSGICHETGHALYEQHLPKNYRHQPVGQALGMAVHESQSLIIEMQACRSREFMVYLSKQLKHYFGKQLSFEPDNLYRFYTRVIRSLIRVDADEVTYPLHVILRYEIEKTLFNDAYPIKDLPELWNTKMNLYLALSTQGDDRNGVLQDVHWPSGAFGYFPAYTLGSLMAAQCFASAQKKYPTLLSQLTCGDFSALNEWLAHSIHAKGSSVDNDTLLQQATGESLNPNYFLQHVKRRYLMSD